MLLFLHSLERKEFRLQRNVHAQLCGYHSIPFHSDLVVFIFVTLFEGGARRFKIKKASKLAWLFLNSKVCGSEIDLRYKSIAFKLSEILVFAEVDPEVRKKLLPGDSLVVYLNISKIKEINDSSKEEPTPTTPITNQKKNDKRFALLTTLSIVWIRVLFVVVANCIKVFIPPLAGNAIPVSNKLESIQANRFRVISRELKTIKRSTKMLSHSANRILNAIDIY